MKKEDEIDFDFDNEWLQLDNSLVPKDGYCFFAASRTLYFEKKISTFYPQKMSEEEIKLVNENKPRFEKSWLEMKEHYEKALGVKNNV